MAEKKNDTVKSPDISKLREVVIDHKTKIYIALDADIEEAKSRYRNRVTTRRTR
jgi:hypothetical protein